MKKTADSFIHTNQEYEKLKKGNTTGDTPRETPAGQSPGRTGYDKQVFDDWTTEEIQDYATKLGIEGADQLDRDELRRQVELRDATQDRKLEPK